MEVPRSEIAYPTLTQIVEVNRRMIATSGGYFCPPDNLQNRDPLAYILDAVQHPVFGVHLFPTLIEKAAALGHEIIASHVFFDGNKRTGIHMAWMFLQSNGRDVVLDRTVEDIAVGMAAGMTPRSEFRAWLAAHSGDAGR